MGDQGRKSSTACEVCLARTVLFNNQPTNQINKGQLLPRGQHTISALFLTPPVFRKNSVPRSGSGNERRLFIQAINPQLL
jgi:hypothetical protein